MLQLRELQQQFIAGLNAESAEIYAHIRSDQHLSAQEHLAIYQSSIAGALQKALREIYPVCHKLVGADFFILLINAYIAKYKSQAPDLASYGEHFPAFIANFPPAKSLVYLADVARLEWAWHKIFTARPSKGIDFNYLAECYQTQGENIIFLPPPDSTLLRSIYPIHRIWEVNQDDYQGEQTITLKPDENYYYLIWRCDLVMRVDILELAEWQLLTWMQAKENLGTITEKILAMETPVDFETLLPNLVSKGWIAEFKLA